MTAMKTRTAGQIFVSEMCANHGIGTRTRRFRRGTDMFSEIMESVQNATFYTGFYGETRQDVFRTAFAPVNAYRKHVESYRVHTRVQTYVQSLTARQFCVLLGDMIDAAVTNVGEGERFFTTLSETLSAH